jgi:SNF2 family DNA or RNA helicase
MAFPAIPQERYPSWRHQRAAYWFVRRLWEQGLPGAMLAMWMGTGKSKVAIDLAATTQKNPVLIICPLRVVDVWRRQFAQHAPHYDFIGLDKSAGSVAAKAARAADALHLAHIKSKPIAIAINYESAWRAPFAPWALRTVWPLIIADEIHRIKQPGGRTSRFAARLRLASQYRLGLTGTPMPHSPLDVYGQYRFLDPSIYDSTYGSFCQRYAIMNPLYPTPVAFRDLEDLKRRFYSIAFRVTEEVLDLPAALDEQQRCALSPEARRAYENLQENFIAWVRSATVTVRNALVKLLRLQQLTSGTLATDDGQAVAIDRSKEQLLEDLLEDLDPGEPVVIFTRFHADLDRVHQVGQRLGRATAELSGRRDDLQLWAAPGGPPLLACQIESGGVGIDLTRARYAVYYSLGFSLASYQQSRARILRPPQQRPVFFYHLLVENSVDEMIMRAIQKRKHLVESALEEFGWKSPQSEPQAS